MPRLRSLKPLRRAALAGAVALMSFGWAPVTLPAGAVEIGPNKSGLPLPRFVTLKSGRVNLRVGPGRNYPVEWMYVKSGLPVEIIQEYDNWRRVRDSEGAEGWINRSLLSGKRSGIAAPWFKGKDTNIKLLDSPDKNASLVASVEPGAVGTIESCDGSWCEMKFGRFSGYVVQTLIWGAYPNEKFED